MLSYAERNSLVVDMYNGGSSLKDISKKFNMSISTVIEVLVENGVEIRRSNMKTNEETIKRDKEILERYKNGESTASISKDVGLSIGAVVYRIKRHGIKMVEHARDDVFDEIDTEEKAYFFGLFCADGWISVKEERGKWNLSLYLQEQDGYIVDRFMKMFHDRKSRPVKKDGKITGYEASINSKRTVLKLMEYGIDSNKSYTLKFPECVPEEFICDFVRGFFDGDGCISGKQTSFVGTKWFISTLIDVMHKYAGVSNKVTPFPVNAESGNDITKSIAWSGIEQARKIRDWMYRNDTATIYIKRKHDKYYSLG